MHEINEAYIQHISQQLDAEKLADFLRYSQQPLRKSIRVNTLKITIADFKQRAKKNQWQLLSIPWCNAGFWLQRPESQENEIPLGNTPEHLLGLIYIQEASSMLPAEILLSVYQSKNNNLPEKILDVAAAPGSKTTQMAALTRQKSLLIANELSSSRLKSLANNFRRIGLYHSCILHKDGQDFSTLTPATFDAILLDAPCSGEGTIRKDAKALKNWALQNVLENSILQKKLIESAFIALKPEGILVYSTCTLSNEENENVCQHLLKIHHAECEIVSLDHVFANAELAATEAGHLKIWPQLFDSEGFFVACFQKVAAKPSANQQDKTAKKNSKAIKPGGYWEIPQTELLTSVFDFFKEHFSFSCTNLPGQFLIKNELRTDSLWLYPEQLDNELFKKIKPNRSGIKICSCFISKKKLHIRLSHEFCIVFGQYFLKNIFHISLQQLQNIYLGKDLMTDQHQLNGDCIIIYENMPVGITRAISGRLKNNLPRELLKDKLDWKLLLPTSNLPHIQSTNPRL